MTLRSTVAPKESSFSDHFDFTAAFASDLNITHNSVCPIILVFFLLKGKGRSYVSLAKNVHKAEILGPKSQIQEIFLI